MALVPQQALLFEGTIRNNLLYGSPEATERPMHEALLIADFAETVALLPAGLDTPVGERGYSLSVGLRQRLALSRVILAAPAVLQLDDCTSALDAETEGRIQLALEHNLPDCTIMTVSHKVASVRRADLIIGLDNSRVIEHGTHAELLVFDGYYAAAYRQQTGALVLT
jgi:ATP-binding cassette, subfamily B, bacterial